MNGEDLNVPDEALLFADGDELAAPPLGAPWKVLVVDDEPDVLAITRVVLADFVFAGAGLEILGAYSRREAEAYLQQHGDVALVLLDVVMEETDGGLRLVRFIRETLGNALVRIVLRTGQPGYAPERDVVLRYDINDYKEKTELTAQKLYTTVVASLRAYQHLAYLERQRAGLEHIVHANRDLAQRRGLGEFTMGALAFLVALAGAQGGIMLRRREAGFETLATVHHAPTEAQDKARQWDGRTLSWKDGVILVPVPSRADGQVCACLHASPAFAEGDGTLLGILAEAVGAGLDSVLLLGRLQDAQKAMVYALARMAEFRDADTGRHVRRVEELVRAMAMQLRNDEEFSELRDEHYLEQLVLASVLHDVGKVGVPDAVLNKPSALDKQELAVMHEHAAIGADILEEAASMVPGLSYISLAAEIAANHHEHADGSGYPRQKLLEDIPISARIVSVADVFDSLVSKRPYKEGWSKAKAIGWLREMAGCRFDGRIVEALAAVVGTSDMVFPQREGAGAQAP